MTMAPLLIAIMMVFALFAASQSASASQTSHAQESELTSVIAATGIAESIRYQLTAYVLDETLAPYEREEITKVESDLIALDDLEGREYLDAVAQLLHDFHALQKLDIELQESYIL